jgi:hypothetical protein
MDRMTVFVKTAKGEEEIRTRQHKLPPAIRVPLILVDGRSTVEELVSKGGDQTKLAEALAYLEQHGFIEPSGVAGTRPASISPPGLQTPAPRAEGGRGSPKLQLIQLMQSLVGQGADKVMAKLNEAPDSRDGLEAAVVACHKLMRLTIDEKKAEEFLARAREILRTAG